MTNDVLWYLLAGSRGGEMRARILFVLKHVPRNAHQLAKALHVDYSTIEHHLKILRENGAVETFTKVKYGAPWRLTEATRASWDEFAEIWERIGTTYKKPKN